MSEKQHLLLAAALFVVAFGLSFGAKWLADQLDLHRYDQMVVVIVAVAIVSAVFWCLFNIADRSLMGVE